MLHIHLVKKLNLHVYTHNKMACYRIIDNELLGINGLTNIVFEYLTPDRQNFIEYCKAGYFDKIMELRVRRCTRINCEGFKYICKNGYRGIIKFLLKKGNAHYGLNGACHGGHMDIVKLMLQNKAFCDNNTLRNACKGGNVDIVKLIIDNGEQAHYKYEWNDILYDACFGGNINIVNLILSKEVFAYERGFFGACKGGHMDIVKYMIRCEYDIYTINNGLMYACEGGNIDIIKMLIEQYGANAYNWGLEGACRGGHMNIVELTINYGADNWCEGLKAACRYTNNDVNIIKLMIEKGVNVDYTELLLGICKDNNNLDIIKLITEKSIEYLNNEIQRRHELGMSDILDTLPEHMIYNKTLYLSLYNACGYGNINIVKYLLEVCRLYCNHESDEVNRKYEFYDNVDNDYSNYEQQLTIALMKACENGNIDIVKLLTKYGGIYNLDGALNVACGFGHMKIARFIMKSGAKDIDWGFEGACEGCHINIIKFLAKKGIKNSERGVKIVDEDMEVLNYLIYLRKIGKLKFDCNAT